MREWTDSEVHRLARLVRNLQEHLESYGSDFTPEWKEVAEKLYDEDRQRQYSVKA